MNILAIDHSTNVCSLALAHDARILAEQAWTADTLRSQQMFPEIQALLKSADIPLGAIDLFTVGLGPGSFSGIRAAFAAMRGFALPDGRTVTGISTAEVLAWPHLHSGGGPVAVVGDVRRGNFSLAVFESPDAVIHHAPVIELLTPDVVLERIPTGSTLVSADWDRVAQALGPLETRGIRAIGHSQKPSAGVLATLTFLKHAAGTLPARPLPIYMHSAVAIAPRISPDAA
jgi:tRNA threonylcarbamoyl adenosine modification protein YeaZ